jgi:hypothetical protein
VDGYAFIASIVHSLAWPSAVVVVAATQRKPVASLLGKIKGAKLWGAELDLSEKIEAVREEIEVAPALPAPPPEQEEPAPSIELEPVWPHLLSEELASTSAIGSIVAEWSKLESAIRWLARVRGMDPTESLGVILRRLQQNAELPQPTWNAIQSLRAMRNSVVHEKNATYGVTLRQAGEYRRAVQEVMGKLGLSPNELARLGAYSQDQ